MSRFRGRRNVNYYDNINEDEDYYYSNYDDYEDDYDDYYYDYDDYYDDFDYYDDYDYDYDYIDYDDYDYSRAHYYDQKNSIENKYRFDNKSSFTKIVDGTINPEPFLDIDDTYLNILMIAEKPSIARTISKILSKALTGNNRFIDLSKKEGWCLYEFNGKFKGKKAHFVVSSVAGHLYETEFLRIHQNYEMEPGELFDVPTVKTECNEDSFITIDWLKNLARGKDILCLWLDCDREGENICYEVIHNVLPYMNKKDYQQIYRAIFSSLTEEDITQSFEQITNYPDNNLSLSIDAREVIDLKVGVSLTRFLTKNILYILPYGLETNCLSYGPCQTPTLWFCVNRQKELEKQNLIYYKVYIKLLLNHKKNVTIYLNRDYKDLNEALKIIEILKRLKINKQKLKVKKLTKEKRQKEHPPGLNTANMLKISSTHLGISPKTTMNIAEKLYIRGYITYPRTETTQYASSFDFRGNLEKFAKDKSFSKDISELISDFDENETSILSGGIDEGDHPPITPARPLDEKLKGKELDLFKLICQYYFASLSPDLEYENLTYEFEVDEQIFDSSCSLIKKIGFLKFLPSQKKEFIDDNDVLKQNMEYEILDIDYEKRKIETYITEAELIEEMEKNHIGTDASMSVHIDNIVKRKYVKVDEKRRLIPTKLGKALIEALETVEPDIVLPKNRAKIEEFVSLLADGKKEYNEVLDYALDFYKKKYYSVSNQLDELYKVFGKYFTLGSDENYVKMK